MNLLGGREVTVNKSLVLLEGTSYFFPKLNPSIKFTPVMEEVLWLLQSFFILEYTPKLSGVVKKLCSLSDRSPNAIGSALKSLVELDLIDYYRVSRGRIIKLQLEHPFFSSALFRFFGCNEWVFTSTPTKGLASGFSLGFLPSRECLQPFISVIENETLKLDTSIATYHEWLNWAKTIKQEIAIATNSTINDVDVPADNPLHRFAEDIVSRLKKQQRNQTNNLTFDELVASITDTFIDFQEIPPWIDDASLHPQGKMMDDYLAEVFTNAQKK